MPHHAIRHIALAIALAALPGVAGIASAAGSQAGDNGRQPIGADNDSPRQAIPNATTNDATVDYTTTTTTTYYEEHPAYLTYYYTSPPTYSTSPPVTDEYSQEWRGYYRYAYPGDTSGRNTNTSPRCEPLGGAAYVDCLHGSAPGSGGN